MHVICMKCNIYSGVASWVYGAGQLMAEMHVCRQCVTPEVFLLP